MVDIATLVDLPEDGGYGPVHRLENGMLPTGGPVNLDLNEGILNWPLQQLAGRTAWLKDAVDTLNAGLAGAISEADVNALIAAAVEGLVGGAPGALDTLNELAAALGDNENFAASVTAALSGKAPVARTITSGSGLSGGGDLSADRTLAVNFASEAEALAGTSDSTAMTPLKTKQLIGAFGQLVGLVKFNGTGVVGILAGYGVSSITDNGWGQYTLNFAVEMPDLNYFVTGVAARSTSVGLADFAVHPSFITTTSVRVLTGNGAGAGEDASVVYVAIYR